MDLVAVEATGGYETLVAATLPGQGMPVVIVNPTQVRAFAQALSQRVKTDPSYATVIARFTEAIRPQIQPLADRAARLLADLMARRRQIVEMITSERQRLHRTEPPRVRKSIERLLKALKRELGTIDQCIDGAVRGSPLWREKEDLQASAPDIGSIIARTLLAELLELGRLDHKKISALAGLAP